MTTLLLATKAKVKRRLRDAAVWVAADRRLLVAVLGKWRVSAAHASHYWRLYGLRYVSRGRKPGPGVGELARARRLKEARVVGGAGE